VCCLHIDFLSPHIKGLPKGGGGILKNVPLQYNSFELLDTESWKNACTVKRILNEKSK